MPLNNRPDCEGQSVSKSTGLARKDASGLQHYDPVKGVKRIASAQAAEKFFSRAKDATGLHAAIKEKLSAQAEFVFWWDTQAERRKKGQPKKSDNGETFLSPGEFGLDVKTLSRWRTKLNDPDKFEVTLASEFEHAKHRIEFTPREGRVSKNTGEHEWYTPAEYLDAARQVLGAIDLDPASTDTANDVVQAAEYFNADQNGLEQPWAGRVWMNPPYSYPLVEDFSQRLAEHVESGAVTAAVVLVNNATETQWFQRLASVSSALCFPASRIRFWNPSKETAAPLQGQALLYVGAEPARFCDVFDNFGFTVLTRKR